MNRPKPDRDPGSRLEEGRRRSPRRGRHAAAARRPSCRPHPGRPQPTLRGAPRKRTWSPASSSTLPPPLLGSRRQALQGKLLPQTRLSRAQVRTGSSLRLRAPLGRAANAPWGRETAATGATGFYLPLLPPPPQHCVLHALVGAVIFASGGVRGRPPARAAAENGTGAPSGEGRRRPKKAEEATWPK